VPGAGGDFEVRSNIRQVLADLKEFDPKLATATRRRLRASGDEAIAEMRGVLGEAPPGGGARSRGSRDAAAGALKTRVVAGRSRQTIRITGSGDPFAKGYNKARGWRHPVFGREPWVQQQGRPYFGSVVVGHGPRMREAIDEALGEAIDAIATNKATGLAGLD
jgi:hypothetical protein